MKFSSILSFIEVIKSFKDLHRQRESEKFRADIKINDPLNNFDKIYNK